MMIEALMENYGLRLRVLTINLGWIETVGLKRKQGINAIIGYKRREHRS